MDKMKRFVVLPFGLLIINLALGFYRDPWRSLSSYRLDFWQKIGYFLRGLSACAVNILLIALLFVFVFTQARVSELFKRPALKAMGIVLAAELAVKLVSDILMKMYSRSALEAVKSGIEPGEWYSVPISLLTSLIHFAVLYFTLRLLLKPLNLSFTLRRWALFDTLVLYVFVSAMNSCFIVWMTEYLNKAGAFTMTSVHLFGMAVSMDGFNALITFGSGLISVLLDLLIFEYFRRCIMDSEEFAPDSSRA
jgi:hypothetical protein